jgi:hypothetical protein
MKTSRELIIEMLEGSSFALTFETDDVLGYRSSLATGVTRAFSINLTQQTVEYELSQKGVPTRRRIEYSPTLAILTKKLPLTLDAFDLKFQGLKLTEQGVSVAERASLAHGDDPWDMTNYFDKPRAEELRKKASLTLADEKLK